MVDNNRSNKPSRPSRRSSRGAKTSRELRPSKASTKGQNAQNAINGDGPISVDGFAQYSDAPDISAHRKDQHVSRRSSSKAGYRAKKNKDLVIPKKNDALSEDGKNSIAGKGSKAHARSVDTYVSPEQKENPLASMKRSLLPAHVNQRSIYKNNPHIYYMNGESLSRPLYFPPSYRMGLIAIIVIAAVVAAIALFFYFDTVANAPARERAQVEELASRTINYDLPNLLSFVEMDDAAIDASLKESGDIFYEKTPLGQGTVYEMIKLPQDLTLEEAAAMYIGGVKNLSAADIVKLLNGSWVLSVDRSYGLNMSLHYADFKSKTLNDAISAAIASEDLERGGPGDSGDNDGYGNAYTTGTIMINGTNYIWTVSALPLKEYYKKSGLPDNATYVGIRIKNG